MDHFYLTLDQSISHDLTMKSQRQALSSSRWITLLVVVITLAVVMAAAAVVAAIVAVEGGICIIVILPVLQTKVIPV